MNTRNSRTHIAAPYSNHSVY